MTRFSEIALLFILTTAIGCSGRDSECRTIVSPLRTLGKKLAAAQQVTGDRSAGAERVVSAVTSFARAATSTSKTLRESSPSIPELSKVAVDASNAAQSLGDSANRMAELAKRLHELESTRRTLRIQRTLAEVALGNIERLCNSNGSDCTRLSKLLLRRPRFPELSPDPAHVANFTRSLSAWLAEVSALKLDNPELEHQIANLEQTSQAFASALVALNAERTLTRDLAAATKSFDAQVDALKATVSAAQDFCKS